MAVFVFCPRSGGKVTAVDGGASGGVGDDHAIAEELADELDVWGFAATGAGAGEFEERLDELGAFDGRLFDLGSGFVGEGVEELEVVVLGFGVVEAIFHFEGALGGGGALAYADAATGAVFGVDLDAHEGTFLDLFALPFTRGEGFGCALEGFGFEGLDADGGVWAGDGAEGASDTGFGVPDGDFAGDAAFFPLRGCGREVSVGVEGAGGEGFAFVLEELGHDVFDIVRRLGEIGVEAVELPYGAGNLDLVEVFDGGVDGGIVFLDDGLTLLGVGLLGGLFDFGDGFFFGEYAGEFEEAGLHDGVDAGAHSGGFGDLACVDDEESNFLVDDLLLGFGGDVIPCLVGGVWAVEEEGGAFLGVGEDVFFLDEAELVAGHEVRALDEVCALDGFLSESQV